jgi:hypothetical protein
MHTEEKERVCRAIEARNGEFRMGDSTGLRSVFLYIFHICTCSFVVGVRILGVLVATAPGGLAECFSPDGDCCDA